MVSVEYRHMNFISYIQKKSSSITHFRLLEPLTTLRGTQFEKGWCKVWLGSVCFSYYVSQCFSHFFNVGTPRNPCRWKLKKSSSISNCRTKFLTIFWGIFTVLFWRYFKLVTYSFHCFSLDPLRCSAEPCFRNTSVRYRNEVLVLVNVWDTASEICVFLLITTAWRRIWVTLLLLTVYTVIELRC
jgi:hypothetical protein